MSENPGTARTVTRDDLIEALTLIRLRPAGGKIVADWMADAILESLDDIAAARRAADDEAWGGRGPSASYEEWLAEGRTGGGGE